MPEFSAGPRRAGRSTRLTKITSSVREQTATSTSSEGGGYQSLSTAAGLLGSDDTSDEPP